MASIRQLQTQRLLSIIAQRLFSRGVKPTTVDVLGRLSNFFAQNPVGQPFPIFSDGIISKTRSNVDVLNVNMANAITNADILYETSLRQVDELIMISKLLQSNLDLLSTRRQKIDALIDDYLLTTYNGVGYFFSISDIFADTSFTDLKLTSAFVDTSIGEVVLPTVASLSKVVSASEIGIPIVQCQSNESNVSFVEISPFNFSTNGLTNTVWEIQVILSTPAEVVATVTVPLGSIDDPVYLSRVDFSPYGITPIQMFTQVGLTDASNNTIYQGIGNIVSGLSPVSFVASNQRVSKCRFTLTKSQYDYTDVQNNAIRYHYTFGAKSIVFASQVYDNNATFITNTLQLPLELKSSMVIDAVALETTDQIPPDTSLTYYVANDPNISATPSIGDFSWKRIDPLSSQGMNNIVSFNGAQALELYINSHPGSGDLELLALDDTNPDITKRNPSPSIISGVNTYILANFADTYLVDSLHLEEGINSTRIYWVPYQAEAVQSLDFWTNIIRSTNAPVPGISAANILYGKIDTGNGFFYGGDIGQNGVSLYVETYLQLDGPIAPLLAKIHKADSNAQTWSVRAFLNGFEVGYLPGRNQDTFSTSATPVGQFTPPLDDLTVPWAFQTGLNHIGVLINIPNPSMVSGIANPYIGVLDLLQNVDIFNLGTVKLADWSYVSFFDLQYNQISSPTSFTIYNNQIISRRQPTNNYRLTYNKTTSTGPQGIRLRADLSRSNGNMNVTPKIQNYRLRFSYEHPS